MANFQFTLIVDGPDLQDAALIDLLFDAGCDDATIGRIDGVQFVDFDREADAIDDAILSAVDDLEKVQGVHVIRIGDAGLASLADIAARLDRTRESVRLLVSGARGPGGFPKPVTDPRSRYRLWRWSEVAHWFKEHRGQLPPIRDDEAMALYNAALEFRHCRRLLEPSDSVTLRELMGMHSSGARAGAEEGRVELAAANQVALEGEVRRIYAEANAYADEVGGVEYGMNILYTPPRLRPKVLVVSTQGAGEDGVRQRTWPEYNQYAVSCYSFGKKMTADFDDAGMARMFRLETVATNLAFPQARDFDKWRRTSVGKGWLERSRAWVDELMGLMAPSVLLTYGSPTFQALTGMRKARGKPAEATYRGIPVVGCSHYSRNMATPEERRAVMARIRELTGG